MARSEALTSLEGSGAPPIVARVGSMWVNPHRAEGGYNGVECDRSDPSASLRHFFGRDVKKAILESGHFNGRSSEHARVVATVDAAVRTLGPVREVYLRDRDREVTVSFGDRVENRLWISVNRVNSRGQVHDSQYLDDPELNLWRLDLAEAPRRTVGHRSQESSRVCPQCYVALPLAPVDACPSCGASVSRVE